jgi:hypothetical protein
VKYAGAHVRRAGLGNSMLGPREITRLYCEPVKRGIPLAVDF